METTSEQHFRKCDASMPMAQLSTVGTMINKRISKNVVWDDVGHEISSASPGYIFSGLNEIPFNGHMKVTGA